MRKCTTVSFENKLFTVELTYTRRADMWIYGIVDISREFQNAQGAFVRAASPALRGLHTRLGGRIRIPREHLRSGGIRMPQDQTCGIHNVPGRATLSRLNNFRKIFRIALDKIKPVCHNIIKPV